MTRRDRHAQARILSRPGPAGESRIVWAGRDPRVGRAWSRPVCRNRPGAPLPHNRRTGMLVAAPRRTTRRSLPNLLSRLDCDGPRRSVLQLAQGDGIAAAAEPQLDIPFVAVRSGDSPRPGSVRRFQAGGKVRQRFVTRAVESMPTRLPVESSQFAVQWTKMFGSA